MKIVFISNFYNHHQVPLCRSLNKYCDSFYFISTEAVPERRIELGYRDLSDSFVVNYFENSLKCSQLIYDADVVLVGSAPNKLIKERLKHGKLVLYYSERLYKKKNVSLFEIPIRTIKYFLEKGRYRNCYLLCASAFTSFDYSKTHTFIDKAYKWGYFPETIKNNTNILLSEKNRNEILWVGRLIEWKHPEFVLFASKKLKDEGFNFKVKIIGTGDLDKYLKELADKLELTDYVSFIGSVPFNSVRNYMDKAGIFLFTSDRNEGWGAVLNEAMNSACSVIVSDEIGSVPYLIENKKNGLIFHSKKIDELCSCMRKLLKNPEKQVELGMAAYNTIINEWNAEIAAERLLSLCNHLLNKEYCTNVFDSGLCSKAEIITDNWFKV